MKNRFLLKEESTIGTLALLAVLIMRSGLAYMWPDTPLFDLASESETILLAPIKVILVIAFTYLVLMVCWPPSYRYIKSIYFNFSRHNLEFQRKFSIGLAAAIFFALVMFASCTARAGEFETRTALVKHLETQLDVREATGKNDGAAVAKYLKHVGLGEGYAWCVAFVSYNLDYFNIPNPKSAWSPHYAKKKDVVWSSKMKINGRAAPGDVFTIYSGTRKRVVHGGFVTNYSKSGDYLYTIEGNTNVEGSREGIGVFARKRSLRKIYAISNYISPYYESISRSTRIDGTLNELPDTACTGLQNSNRQHDYNNIGNSSGYDTYHPSGFDRFKNTIVSRFFWVDPVAQVNNQKQSSTANGVSERWCFKRSGQLRQLGCGTHIERFNHYYAQAPKRVNPTNRHRNKEGDTMVGKRLVGIRRIGCAGVNHIYWNQNI